jgi:hypothetical protein
MFMKTKTTQEREGTASFASAFKNVCVASCRNILVQIAAAKEAIFTDSFKELGAHEHLLRLALNEAEAVSWETKYPQLIFPGLATEKVQSVMAWAAQQQLVLRPIPVYRRAA